MSESDEINLPYYFNDIDRNESESILQSIKRPGCFLIRRHKQNSSILSSSLSIESPYVLSIVAPSLKIVHFLIYRINKYLSIKVDSDEYYKSLKELVQSHKLNSGILPCKLIEYPIRIIFNNDQFSLPHLLNINETQLIRKEIIGQGYFGIVYKGLLNDKIPVAIKTCSTSCESLDHECESNMLYEFALMSNINHSNIVHYYGLVNIDNKLNLVTEFIPNGSLLFWLNQKQNTNILINDSFIHRLNFFSFQICDAMDYLERKLIIHRDLAARNCLIDDDRNNIKLIDFGMAKIVPSSSMIYEEKFDKPFPLRWSSPEVLIYRKYSSKSDIWSYGVLLWEIYSLGQIPYGQSTSNDTIIKLIKKGQPLNKPKLVNKVIYKQIMLRCWNYNVNDRPPFYQFKELFNKIN